MVPGVSGWIYTNLGCDEINLGGLSLGGEIALGYSLKYPQKVKKLVLIAPYGLSNKIPYSRLTQWLLKHPRMYDGFNRLMLSNRTFLKSSLKMLLLNPDALKDNLVAEVMEAARQKDNSLAWKAFQLSKVKNQKLRTCYSNQLHELNMPVLLLTGKKDSLVPSRDFKRASRLIPRSKLVELEECGHWIPRDKSDEFTQALENFI